MNLSPPHKIINVMRGLEIWFQKNNFIINTGKTFDMGNAMRVLLRQQIIFKTMKIASESELRSIRIYITENLKWDGCSCSIIESQAMQSSLYDEHIKALIWSEILLFKF
jgi:hypothetical protein